MRPGCRGPSRLKRDLARARPWLSDLGAKHAIGPSRLKRDLARARVELDAREGRAADDAAARAGAIGGALVMKASSMAREDARALKGEVGRLYAELRRRYQLRRGLGGLLEGHGAMLPDTVSEEMMEPRRIGGTLSRVVEQERAAGLPWGACAAPVDSGGFGPTGRGARSERPL